MAHSPTPIPILWLGAALLALPGAALDSSEPQQVLAAILEAAEPPPGVVFEIVTEEEDGLEWALPRVREHIRFLRARHPRLPVAVVSHGEEMFGLADEAAGGDPDLHDEVARLRERLDVTVHVCGTFAGWRGLAPEDFPPVVDVAPAGPVQVNDYRALGWTVIRITDED